MSKRLLRGDPDRTNVNAAVAGAGLAQTHAGGGDVAGYDAKRLITQMPAAISICRRSKMGEVPLFRRLALKALFKPRLLRAFAIENPGRTF